MPKKDNRQSDLEEMIARAREHDTQREVVEYREENPRDIVALAPNSDGELIPRRIPLRLLHLDKNGHEIPDPVPVAPPVSTVPQSPLDRIREHNRRLEYARLGHDWPDATLEEEDNFDIPDDPIDPATSWEMAFEVASIAEINARARQIVAARRAEAQKESANPPSDGPRTPDNKTPSNKTPPSE